MRRNEFYRHQQQQAWQSSTKAPLPAPSRDVQDQGSGDLSVLTTEVCSEHTLEPLARPGTVTRVSGRANQNKAEARRARRARRIRRRGNSIDSNNSINDLSSDDESRDDEGGVESDDGDCNRSNKEGYTCYEQFNEDGKSDASVGAPSTLCFTSSDCSASSPYAGRIVAKIAPAKAARGSTRSAINETSTSN